MFNMELLSLLKKIIFILIIYILWVCLSCKMEGKTFSFRCLKNIKSFIKKFQKKIKLFSYRESFETESSYIPENDFIDELNATQINTYKYLKTKYEAALSQTNQLWDPDWINKEWKLKTNYDHPFFSMGPETMFEEYILYNCEYENKKIEIATDTFGNVIEDKSNVDDFKVYTTGNDITGLVQGDIAYKFSVIESEQRQGLFEFYKFKTYADTIAIPEDAYFKWDVDGVVSEQVTGVRYGEVDMDTYVQDFLACLVNEIDVLNKYVNHLQKVNRMGDDMMMI